jgi:hypothetical protein
MDNCFCPTMYYEAAPQFGNETLTKTHVVSSGFTSRPDLLVARFYFSVPGTQEQQHNTV